MTVRRLCTFRVDGLLLGVDVDRVQEITGDQMITPVPLADPHVVGLLNLRGQILTVIDARARLDLGPRQAADGHTHAILRLEDEAVSFLVDGAGDVVEIEADAVEEVPSTVPPAIGAVMVGACPIESELLLLLDIDVALSGAGH